MKIFFFQPSCRISSFAIFFREMTGMPFRLASRNALLSFKAQRGKIKPVHFQIEKREVSISGSLYKTEIDCICCFTESQGFKKKLISICNKPTNNTISYFQKNCRRPRLFFRCFESEMVWSFLFIMYGS